MAIMHPSDITKRKHVRSEEKFFNACRDQLSEKYHVFFSVRWYSVDENGQREDSECDFLIFNPDYGYLCIEVKGSRGIYTDEDGDWYLQDFDEDRKLRRSPYLQAEESMRFFKKYYEDELETRFPGTYGSAVAFPNFCVNSQLSDSSPLALTIDMNGVQNLSTRIVEIFRYYRSDNDGRSFFFSPDSQKKFISLINKRIALSVAAGALIQDKELELAEINQTQDVVIDLLSNYKKAFIVGGAGTGKTWIGIKKILRNARSGKQCLYLCYNKSLADMARVNINNPVVDSFDIDSIAKKVLEEDYENVIDRSELPKYGEAFSEIEDSLPKYDLIVVDEAQDFSEDWAFAVNLLLKADAELYVLYDESQNVFNRNFGDKFFIDTPPFVLRYNIRNTSNIYKYTQEKTSLGLDTVANQIEGVEPDVRKCSRKQQAISFLDSIVNKLVNSEGVTAEKITIVCNRGYESSVLSEINSVGGIEISKEANFRKNNEILFQKVEDFKGLESDIVIYIKHTYTNEPMTEAVRSIDYTAMTRARFYLYVIEYTESI